ncbi:hypothetical protein WJX74_008925 [Apatococcus lobatus]|uniref:RRP15-like protein n=1 Tax=Apatococcus lobatus TaxID=904363 RepID=A0AAW1QI52_9CHLO
MAEGEVVPAMESIILKPRKKQKIQKPGPSTDAAAAVQAAAKAGLDMEGDLDSDGDAAEVDELAAADEEADVHASRKSGAAPTDASFADAFAEILAHPGPAGGQAAPILAASKSLAKRKREEAEAEAGQREHRRLRQEMRRRGHVAVPKKGDNPPIDMREKELMRTATRGVVRLFNAVAAAQQKQADLEATGGKGAKAKLTKASFLADLRGQMQPSQAAAPNPKVVPISRASPAAAITAAAAEVDTAEASHSQEPIVAAQPGPSGRQAALQLQKLKAQPSGTKAQHRKSRLGIAPPQEPANEPAWAVLQAGFSGLQGGSKLKDWDREVDSDDAAAEEQFDDMAGDSE